MLLLHRWRNPVSESKNHTEPPPPTTHHCTKSSRSNPPSFIARHPTNTSRRGRSHCQSRADDPDSGLAQKKERRNILISASLPPLPSHRTRATHPRARASRSNPAKQDRPRKVRCARKLKPRAQTTRPSRLSYRVPQLHSPISVTFPSRPRDLSHPPSCSRSDRCRRQPQSTPTLPKHGGMRRTSSVPFRPRAATFIAEFNNLGLLSTPL